MHPQEALDIMQKHGADLADRPRSVSSGEIISNDLLVLLARYGDRLKRLRRALHSQLQPSAAKEYQPLQYKHAKQCILDILHEPEQHMGHVRRYAASVILSLVYGKKTPTRFSDPEVVAMNLSMKRIADCLRPGACLVDRFPFLKYLPTPETRRLRSYRDEWMALFRSQFDVIRRQIAQGEDIPPSFSAYLLKYQSTYQLSDDEASSVTGELFGAGTDTTATAITFVSMAAACYPHEQAKVQAQLDSIVGRTRAPNFDDQNELPLVTAFLWEAHRWRPVSNGAPHRALRDIAWNGYVIPSGATVLGNHWSILRDPEVFPDPQAFRPDRWLDEHGQLKDDPKMLGFGFGRRSVYINTALLLWAFQISEDPSDPIDPMAFDGGISVHIHPFKLRFQPRINNLEEALRHDSE
ncbi:hypothetical protein NLI96_g1776 [Meripilus lineatus]|uniref:Cytochrome P450 n=1 Tax=Meripilus lineatus TaxID=2056292 RepID=A0AAD5V9X4_9APHY|nr:hypothetical protein NLI96_g1776 [Physisporinus lineatus]